MLYQKLWSGFHRNAISCAVFMKTTTFENDRPSSEAVQCITSITDKVAISHDRSSD